MPARVLFVDDDVNVLQALRRMMRVVRKEWDMDFAEGASEALQRMAGGRYDVVVSDIRMPGMDGAALLAATATRHPYVIRIVLSGQCDQEASCRLVGHSHQFHNKPCDSGRLVTSLRRALALRDRLQRDDVRQLVAGLHALPSPPAVQDQLLDALRATRPTVEDIGAIVAGDMGLTAKLLQLANSGYFGPGASVVLPTQAVQRLGVEQLQTLVAGYDLIWRFEPEDCEDARQMTRIEAIWHLAPACGRLARQIAESAGLEPAAIEAACVAGLLHATGELILKAHGLKDQGDSALVGAYLVGLWGLPEVVVEAIAGQDASPADGAGFDTAQAVQIAKALLGGPESPAVDRNRLAKQGVLDRLPGWQAMAKSAQQGEGSRS